jgi:hypothetical protein
MRRGVFTIGGLNWYAVLVATASYWVLGVPWFSPATFGDVWERAIGFRRPDPWEPGALLYLIPLFSSFAAAVSTAVLARATGSVTVRDGVILGLVAAVGYSVAVAGVDAISPSHPEPMTLFLITGSYHFIGLIVVAVIVTVWTTRGGRGAAEGII